MSQEEIEVLGEHEVSHLLTPSMEEIERASENFAELITLWKMKQRQRNDGSINILALVPKSGIL